MFRQTLLAAGLALLAASFPSHAQKSVDFLQFSKGWGRIVADFDGDGHPDLFITGHDSDDRIWYWTPTGYQPGAQSFPWVDRHACAAADVNRDGRMDFFCNIGGEGGYATAKANELWIQQANGRFVQAPGTGAEDPTGRGRIPVFLDLNHDGYPDLYVTNESTPRTDGLPNWNHLYLNQKDSTFVEVQTAATGSAALGLSPGYDCAVKGDVDGDGWDDLLVCQHNAAGHVFVNNHANDFSVLATPAASYGWKDAALADMNGDGRDDLVVITVHDRLQVWLNAGIAPWFTKPALDVALPNPGQGLTVGQFNADNRRDVYVALANATCGSTGPDTAPDVVFLSTPTGSWQMQVLPQAWSGCGHLAATVGERQVLVENGTPALTGPHYLLTF